MLGEAKPAAFHSVMAPGLLRAVMAFVAILASPSAHADPLQPDFSQEVWAGADVASHVWLTYTGVTVAPYGGIFADGLRIRTAAGYGEYRYSGERDAQPRSFAAQTVFTDVLVGYLKRLGPLTAKAFVGAAAIEHDIKPNDPENPVRGLAYGPKAVGELWLNMGQSAWSSLDLSWTSAHQTYAGRVRTGYHVLQGVSLGVEARVDGNELDKDTRGGLFVRYDWTGGEVSLAGGVAGRFLENATDVTDPYATFNWLMQY
jgi:Cellulose biosynthesis protein BcsS